MKRRTRTVTYNMGKSRSVRAGWVDPEIKINGKTVLITGANTGIGFETARDLATRGARVIMACRNLEKAEDAKYKIVQTTGHTDVVVKQLNLASFESIRNFAEDINTNEERLDVLINNAGLLMDSYRETDDGYEMSFAVNHLGHFLLTNLLLDLLKRSSPSRIVTVSSSAHQAARINWNDLNLTKNFNGLTAYSQSKLMNILFTRQISILLKGSGVTANCLHPGIVQTEVFREVDGCCQFGFIGCIMYSVTQVCTCKLVTPDKGAQTSIYCAVAPEIETVSGKYFESCKVSSETRAARSKEVAERLWKISSDYTGI